VVRKNEEGNNNSASRQFLEERAKGRSIRLTIFLMSGKWFLLAPEPNHFVDVNKMVRFRSGKSSVNQRNQRLNPFTLFCGR
jgi:hypothetical protein